MKILLAVDGHEVSQEAAEIVGDWFPEDSSIVALHVGSVAPVTMTTSTAAIGGMAYPVMPMATFQQNRDRVFQEAREIAARAASVAHGEVRAEAGDPASKIIEVAEEIGADLIVVGTGDRGWLDRIFQPSVSKKVVDSAPCSVLVVRTH